MRDGRSATSIAQLNGSASVGRRLKHPAIPPATAPVNPAIRHEPTARAAEPRLELAFGSGGVEISAAVEPSSLQVQEIRPHVFRNNHAPSSPRANNRSPAWSLIELFVKQHTQLSWRDRKQPDYASASFFRAATMTDTQACSGIMRKATYALFFFA